jgi:hypothetical protein
MKLKNSCSANSPLCGAGRNPSVSFGASSPARGAVTSAQFNLSIVHNIDFFGAIILFAPKTKSYAF